MGRSVSVPRGAASVVYEACEFEDSWGFEEAIEDLRGCLMRAFPSVTEDDRWLDREDHVIASNRFAQFGVSEYCGLVSIWMVPVDNDYADTHGIRDRWIESVDAKFRKVASGCFGVGLNKLGTFSNGEAIFSPADGQQRGDMGLGFSSKEGWL